MKRQNLPKPWIVVWLGMPNEQQAGLGGDGDPYFFSDRLAAAPDEGLFRDEHLDVALELELQIRRQARSCGHTAAQDAAPSRRKGLRSQSVAATLGPPRLRHQAHHAQQHDGGQGQHRQDVAEHAGNHIAQMGPRQTNSTCGDRLNPDERRNRQSGQEAAARLERSQDLRDGWPGEGRRSALALGWLQFEHAVGPPGR